MRDYQKYAAILAVFATVLYAAVLVAAFGMISLATNLDVIADRSAGPLVGPTMSAAATVLVLLMLMLFGLRTPPDKQRVAVGFAVATGVTAYALFISTGAILVAAGNGEPLAGLLFSGSMLGSPFAISVGVLAFLVALTYSILLASRYGEHGRPLWPWERRGE
ncbi:hypothetical protein E3O42_16795 [Cryobacterium adonitolivorans]|uniref:Uncharacterized protein n=1 Tax=Cryobacterium adonitolivorans TaxID=1259189 RepID=A0A4R8VXV2_9MICO|nr:DUF6121 family protein [Cryobacterium adonitolivorans]TFB96795.1 hypothetical protein E3O42_16795 [Cryobacterium adonitolivorans]